MPNQRAIAAALGITQATVSLALRDDPSIPQSTKEQIEAMARKLGYRPNPLVSSLMEHIRTGRNPKDQGCIAILVDRASEKEWLAKPVYRLQYTGYCNQARKRGYRTECFYLKAPGMTPEQIDRQLYSRGITGVILAAPRTRETPPENIRWDRYAFATVSYTWRHPQVDRVSSHHRHNVDLAFAEIQRRGYQRIGMCLPHEALGGVDSNWMAGFLVFQSRLPAEQRIPLFAGYPDETPFPQFQKWYNEWKPDVLVVLVGDEVKWLKKLGLTFDDVGLVCLNRPVDSTLTGIDENNIVVGAMTCDIVVNQLTHNERGIPEHPRVILIEGTWTEGNSLPGRSAAPAPRPKSRRASKR